MHTLYSKTRAAKTAFLLAAGFALGTAILPAQALDVAGVTYQTSTLAGNTRLLLNGAGVAQHAAAGLYTAGLYLEKKMTTPQQVLAHRGRTQLRLVMLRDVSAQQLAYLVTQGLVANASDDELASMVADIFDVGVLLSEQGDLRAGDSLQIDSQPHRGTAISIHSGGRSGYVTHTFANPLGFKVMMNLWLGQQPVDPGLKNALLGQPI